MIYVYKFIFINNFGNKKFNKDLYLIKELKLNY